MAKNFLIAFVVFFMAIVFARADQQCVEEKSTITQNVLFRVDTDMPKYLSGAKIIVRLADGRESVVPAEKFKVVPRKQQFVAGKNKIDSSRMKCKVSSARKNSIMVGARRDHAGMDVITSTTNNSVSAKVESKKALVPDISYYRREILDSHLGIGAGVDQNGTVRGILGLDF